MLYADQTKLGNGSAFLNEMIFKINLKKTKSIKYVLAQTTLKYHISCFTDYNCNITKRKKCHSNK